MAADAFMGGQQSTEHADAILHSLDDNDLALAQLIKRQFLELVEFACGEVFAGKLIHAGEGIRDINGGRMMLEDADEVEFGELPFLTPGLVFRNGLECVGLKASGGRCGAGLAAPFKDMTESVGVRKARHAGCVPITSRLSDVIHRHRLGLLAGHRRDGDARGRR